MTPTNLREWADQHRVRVRRSEDGSPHVPGRDGEVYEYAPGRLGVMVLDSTPRKWGFRRRKCEAAGMATIQNGDFEGTCLLDAANDEQAAVAIDVAHIKRKRVMSEAQLEALARAREASPLVRTGSPAASKSDGRSCPTEDPDAEVIAA